MRVAVEAVRGGASIGLIELSAAPNAKNHCKIHCYSLFWTAILQIFGRISGLSEKFTVFFTVIGLGRSRPASTIVYYDVKPLSPRRTLLMRLKAQRHAIRGASLSPIANCELPVVKNCNPQHHQLLTSHRIPATFDSNGTYVESNECSGNKSGGVDSSRER
jgi:hypothetical protein